MSTQIVPYVVEQRLVVVLQSKTNLVLPAGYRPVEFRVVAGPDVKDIGPSRVAILTDSDSAIPLPWVWDADGDLVPLEGFLIDFLPEAVRLIWVGDTVLPVSRLVNGLGIEFPLPGAVRLPPGAPIILTHRAPMKVEGTGVLMRDGKVVRDVLPTEAEAAQDRLVEQSYAARS